MLINQSKYGPLFLLLILIFISCEKEYSYEGGDSLPPTVTLPIDSTFPGDTTHYDPGALMSCSSCKDSPDIAESSWSFKTGNSLLCGTVDTAFILGLERSSFTFFGPSACGGDSGLIFTVYLSPNTLKRDTSNMDATYAVFYYYHTGQPYILTSHSDQSFNLTISSYVHATKMVTGTFRGTGFRDDGRAVSVVSGKFRIRLL